MNKKRPSELAEKISVTIPKKTLRLLRKYADLHHEGNVSRAIVEAVSELAAQAARDQAARELFELLGKTEPLTKADTDAIRAEQAGGPRYEPREPRASRLKKGRVNSLTLDTGALIALERKGQRMVNIRR